MSLSHLEIANFRNLNELKTDFSPRFNLIYGNNGSGKTSILEAIHYLGLARSFRTHLNSRIITHDQSCLTLYGIVQKEQISVPIGIQRHINGESQIKISGKSIDSTMDLAALLPLQFINAEAQRLLFGGPKYRRQFLDWGLFHVEQTFLPLWQRAFRALKQRNALLRPPFVKEQLSLWNNELASAALELSLLRQQYVEAFSVYLLETLKGFFNDRLDIRIHYYQGWPQDKDLFSILEENIIRDRELGYSQYGPQKADLKLHINNIPLHDCLSQGQQKLVIYAMRLAQGAYLYRQTNKRCIYLIDDLPAELDTQKRRAVAEALKSLQSQVFITGIEQQDLINLFPKLDYKKFHVEQGKLLNP